MWLRYTLWSLLCDLAIVSAKADREEEEDDDDEREEKSEECSLCKSSMLGKRSEVDRGNLAAGVEALESEFRGD